MFFDIKSELASYGEYHANKVNVAIHMVFVPAILWASLAILTSLTPRELFSVPPALQVALGHLPGPPLLPNASLLGAVGYGLFYVLLDPLAGALALPLLYGMLVSSQEFVLTVCPQRGLHCAIGVFVFAWIAQFVGHGVYERRAPALLDNLVQALVMAPFFVFLELLFALGYRPQLHRELRNEVGRRILRHRQQHKKTK